MSAKVRLYIDTPLQIGADVTLTEAQSHYLCRVMKLGEGDAFIGFDGVSGEYDITITKVLKKYCQASVGNLLRPMSQSPDIWLLFAPVKKEQTDYIVQKSVELGVRVLQPVITNRTNSEKVRRDRLIAQGIEASEQCRRLDIPKVEDAQPLEKILQNWDSSRKLFYMDETRQGRPVSEAFKNASAPAAILVGPEGGFSDKELTLLRQLNFAYGVTLGPRILRAETAVAAALSCWQALSGDWINYTEQK